LPRRAKPALPGRKFPAFSLFFRISVCAESFSSDVHLDHLRPEEEDLRRVVDPEEKDHQRARRPVGRADIDDARVNLEEEVPYGEQKSRQG